MVETASRAWLSRRMINGYCALLCGGLLGFALFAEHALGYEPCPLCVLQRIAVLVVGFIFLAAYAHNPGRTGARVYGLMAIVAAGAGFVLAWRQVWLQGLPPDQVPACGPGYDYIMDVFPLHEALSMIFEGSGDCAEMGWTFLGLSMAGWVLIWMAGFALVAAWNNFRR